MMLLFIVFSKSIISGSSIIGSLPSNMSSSPIVENISVEQFYEPNNLEQNITYLKIKTKKLLFKTNGSSGIDPISVEAGSNNYGVCQLTYLSHSTLPYPSGQFKYEYKIQVLFNTSNYTTCNYSFEEGSLYNRTISGKKYKNKAASIGINYPIQKPGVILNINTPNLTIDINHGSNYGVVVNSSWIQKEVKVLYKANFLGYSNDANDSFFEEEVASFSENSILDLCNISISNNKAFFNGFFEIKTSLEDSSGTSTHSYFMPASFLNGKVNIFGDIGTQNYFSGYSETHYTCPKQTVLLNVSPESGLHLIFDDVTSLSSLNSLSSWNNFFQLTGANQFTNYTYNSSNKEVILTGGTINELFPNDLLKTNLIGLVDTNGTIKKVSDEAFINSNLKKVFLSDAEDLSFRAFQGSKKLLEFDAPKLKNAKDASFQDCWSLQELNFPDLVTMGNYFCKNCYSLRFFSANNAISAYTSAFERTINLLSISMNNLVSLGVQSFFNSSKLRNITLPSLRGIGTKAFFNTYLSELSLPQVTYIGTNPIGVISPLGGEQASLLNSILFGPSIHGRTISTTVSSFFTTIQDYQTLKSNNTITETIIN